MGQKYANGLCVYILIKYMRWYLGVIRKLHKDQCLIYLFIGEVLNGTSNIFTNSQYYCWLKQSMDKFYPVLNNTTHENAHFKKLS